MYVHFCCSVYDSQAAKHVLVFGWILVVFVKTWTPPKNAFHSSGVFGGFSREELNGIDVFCGFHSEVSIFMMDLDSKLEVLFVPLKHKRGRDVWKGKLRASILLIIRYEL